ncbi:putative cis-zeatin O-glucosyltransferase, partial [Dendrobium catenatum]|uniref:putative cis-zeatin O-glucosyltransferase n=1 Tax=Dendrobium catenatum TaxID=906689 RepID=UPI00109FF420
MLNADEVTVVIVPLPAHGHLNPLLHFSLLLSTRYGLTVHFASTASHNRQAKLRLQGWPLSSLSSIHFHDLPHPPIPSPPPNPQFPNSFPTHLQPLFDATDHLRSPLSSLLLSLSASSRRLIVIHDRHMSLGFDAATIPNAESYAFCGTSAAFHFEAAQLMKQGTGLEELASPEFIKFIERRRRDGFTSSGFIINTCREVESEFLDILALREDFLGKPIFAIGPLNPVPIHNNADINRDECLEWLDGHPPCSVVYVSFGTTSTISDEQAEQLASGLRR